MLIAALVAAAVLVLGAVVVVLSSGNDAATPQTPPSASQQAAALAGAEAPYFSADECFTPTPSQAPFVFNLPTSRVVKCGDPSARFTGTFWCAGSQQDFDATRRGFLVEASGTPLDIPSTFTSAGAHNMTDGIRKEYRHSVGGTARVYWDSESAWCGAELQSSTPSLEAAVAFWSQGA